ncbi:MAG: serine/threonine protein kinase [Candidatus Obscuribacterales bacterium]|nr:serine/threonine protein kinase [Candidatus Obscuribacterales bacterium]
MQPDAFRPLGAPAIEFPSIEGMEILDLLGQGGMSRVYRARQTALERFVAVKVSKANFHNEADIRRFMQEARLCSKLEHPNVVKILSFGISSDDSAYFSMELLEGKSLAEELLIGGRLSLERFRFVFVPILRALAYAHRQDLVHRDVKPANIMICKSDEHEIVKLLDFGVAKHIVPDSELSDFTRSGSIIGSPSYMSPEQCSGKNVDSRSDIYSLGCVMYEALLGEPPFKGDSAFDLMQRHLKQAPPTVAELSGKIEISRDLSALILSALAKDPELRPQSADKLADDLSQVLDRISLSNAPRLKAPRAKNRSSFAWILGLSLAGLCALFGYALRYSRNANSIEPGLDQPARSFGVLSKESKDEFVRGNSELAYQKAITALALLRKRDMQARRKDFSQGLADAALCASACADNPLLKKDDPKRTQYLHVLAELCAEGVPAAISSNDYPSLSMLLSLELKKSIFYPGQFRKLDRILADANKYLKGTFDLFDMYYISVRGLFLAEEMDKGIKLLDDYKKLLKSSEYGPGSVSALRAEILESYKFLILKKPAVSIAKLESAAKHLIESDDPGLSPNWRVDLWSEIMTMLCGQGRVSRFPDFIEMELAKNGSDYEAESDSGLRLMNTLGQVYMAEGKYDKVIANGKRGLELFSAEASAGKLCDSYEQLALAFNKLGKKSEAQEYIAKFEMLKKTPE